MENKTIEKNLCQFKIVILGDSRVGKSSLIMRFIKSKYRDHNEATIGAAFGAKSFCIGDTIVKLGIWDTAGQERYRSMAPLYYRDAQGAIVVYDISSLESFDRINNWITDLQRYVSSDIIIALAGNKVDMSDQRMVTFKQGQSFAEKNSFIFMETSAKTATNVEEIFLSLAREILASHQPTVDGSGTNEQGKKGVELGSENKEHKCKC